MTIIVEDGSNVANSNSYLSLNDIRTYASLRGVTLSVVDATLEPMVIKAMDYIESFRDQFQGMQTYDDQSLQWPRSEIEYVDETIGYVASSLGIMIDCRRIDPDVIPKVLKDLLCQCTMAVNAGIDFANFSQEQKFVTSEQIGPLKQTYANPTEGGSTSGVPYIESIMNMIDILLYPCNDGVFLRTVRV
jgi:hypothetical protein